MSSVEMGRITVQSRLNEIKCAIVTLLQNMSGKSTGKKERNREEENQSIYSSYLLNSTCKSWYRGTCRTKFLSQPGLVIEMLQSMFQYKYHNEL